VKCYEVKPCTPRERESCFVWNQFKGNPDELENIKCWVLKADNPSQLATCRQCKYYIMMNMDTGIVSQYSSDVAIVTCEGVLNEEKTHALEQVWETLRKNGKKKVLLRVSNLNNVYSCGLGLLIRIHKETSLEKGLLVIQGAHGYVQAVLEASKLNKIIKMVPEERQAAEIFSQMKRTEEEAAKPKAEVKPPEPPKQRPPCYVYFKNHNPRNATICDECSKKINPSDQPCWVVEGIVEGIIFQYVSEECADCPYYEEFSGASAQEIG
jgi:anti-sigma B factor antagonist